jgi:hypothetical protein
MKPLIRVLITVGILIALITGFYYTSKTITAVTGKSILGWIIKDNNENSTNLDSFAKCLTDKGVKMYGAFWCGHCQNEKKSFGDSWQYIKYIECDPKGENSQTDLCLSKNIQGYPTWEINGKLYPGEQSFDKLAQLSGCKLD